MKNLAVIVVSILFITSCNKEQEVILNSETSINSVSHDTVNVSVVVNVTGDIHSYERGVLYGPN